MAEITLMHQEIIMLKLRITALESQRNELENNLTAALAENQLSETKIITLTEKLKNTERVCSTLEVEILRERRTSNAAMHKIEQLENQLLEAFSDDSY